MLLKNRTNTFAARSMAIRLAISGVLLALTACGGTRSISSSSNSLPSSSFASSSSVSNSSSISNSSSTPSSHASSSSSSSRGLLIPAAVTQSVVRFVYFVEKDALYNPAMHEALRQQAFAIQHYWYDQFGGTFYLYDQIVDVIYADQNANWYLNTPDNIHADARWYRLGNIKNEVYRKTGTKNFDSKVRVINYPSSRHDGRVGGNFGGAWMDGDDLTCLLGNNNGYNFPYDEQNPAHCTGHVVHEFGHVFGLDHVGPDTDCMRYGFYISGLNAGLCNFSTDNRNTVKNNPQNATFLQAMPGQVVNRNGQIEAR